MIRFLYSAALLLSGVVLGWWLHGQWSPTAPAAVAHSTGEAGSAIDRRERTDRIQLESYSPGGNRDKQPHSVSGAPRAGVEENPAGAVRQFQRLLEMHQFEQAMAYYEQTIALGEAWQAALKPVASNYLKSCLQQCPEGAFVTLVDAWLAIYYEDIPALLLLAEYQRMQGFPEEAARTLQLAMTYAYQPSQRESVTLALRRLVRSTDDFLSQNQRWIELAGFYELLESIALSQPSYRLRQATIYGVMGEPSRSREILLALQQSDDQLDPQWSKAIANQLAGMAPDPAPSRVAAIPLKRHGEHYLVETTLNSRQQVVLIIDTGASITSLSETRFAGMSDAWFESRGSRLFNTANGLTRGEVYRAASMALGDIRIEGIDIAVLDYQPSAGIDGLLGMNFLRNFRFEIDQEEQLLYLQPR